jgi:hypothetical protein
VKRLEGTIQTRTNVYCHVTTPSCVSQRDTRQTLIPHVAASHL